MSGGFGSYQGEYSPNARPFIFDTLWLKSLCQGKTAEEIRTIFNIRQDFENEDKKETANETSEGEKS